MNKIKRLWWRLHTKKVEKFKLKIAEWLFDRWPERFCWADCVRWTYSTNLNPLSIDGPTGCKIESIDHVHKLCYCGVWQNGECFYSKPKEEQERIKKELDEEYQVLPEDLPF